MAGYLLQLKLRSIANGFNRTSGLRRFRVGSVIGTVAIIAAVGVGCALLWGSSVGLVRTVTVLLGTLAIVGTFVVALLNHREEPIDPRALAVLGVSPTRASFQALVAHAISIPAIGALAALVAMVLLWFSASSDEQLRLFAVIAAVLGFVVLVLTARLGTMVGALMAERRVAGDAQAAIVLVATIALSPAVFFAVSTPWTGQGSRLIAWVVDMLSFTPLGALWATPASAYSGNLLLAAIQVGIAVLFIVLLSALWDVFVRRRIALALFEGEESKEIDFGLIGRVGRTPAGAVGARTLTYGLRDRRYGVISLTAILVPLLVLVPLAISGVPAEVLVLVPVPVLAFFLGFALHNDLAYDGSAVWLHLTSALKGRSDRLGRALPTIVFGTVAVLLGSALTALIAEDWIIGLGTFGVSICLLYATVGTSSIMSVIAPYPVARPGDSPFSQPVRSWGASVALHPLAGLFAILLASPALGALIFGLVGDGRWWFGVAALCGVVVGVLFLLFGVWLGGRLYERRASEIMTFALAV